MSEAFAATRGLAIARALFAEGRLDESRVAFENLLKSTARADALYGLAVIALRHGDNDGAQVLFEQSLGVKRNNPDALYYLARIHSTKGNRNLAIALLGEALSCDPLHDAALRDISKLAGEESGLGWFGCYGFLPTPQ